MKRLHFIEKAFGHDLNSSGFCVLFLACIECAPFVNVYFKLQVNNGVVYIRTDYHKELEDGCDIISEISNNYINSLNGWSDYYNKSEYIENQIYFKTLVDSLGDSSLYSVRISEFSKQISNRFENLIEFSENLDSIDLSVLFMSPEKEA